MAGQHARPPTDRPAATLKSLDATAPGNCDSAADWGGSHLGAGCRTYVRPVPGTVPGTAQKRTRGEIRIERDRATYIEAAIRPTAIAASLAVRRHCETGCRIPYWKLRRTGRVWNLNVLEELSAGATWIAGSVLNERHWTALSCGAGHVMCTALRL